MRPRGVHAKKREIVKGRITTACMDARDPTVVHLCKTPTKQNIEMGLFLQTKQKSDDPILKKTKDRFILSHLILSKKHKIRVSWGTKKGSIQII